MSDLHIGYKDFKARFISIIDNLKSEMPGKPSRYIVVITGDLVHNANKKGSYDNAREGLDYLQQSGFKHVFVIPGKPRLWYRESRK